MRESIVDFIFKQKLFDVAYWCPLNVAVRNLTLALFLGAGGLGARVSSWAVWWCWALWMGLWVSHHRDATPGFLVASVSPVALWSMFEGYTVGLWVCEGFLSVFKYIHQKIDQAQQPLIYSPEPRNMLQSAPVRVTNPLLCIWHGKNSPNKGINTNFVFLGRHNIYAVLQVAYCCKRGFWLVYIQIWNKSPKTSANDQLSYKIQLGEYWEGVEGSV